MRLPALTPKVQSLFNAAGVFGKLMLLIAACEAVVMAMLHRWPVPSHWAVVADPLVLSLLSAPLLSLLFLRPLRQLVQRHEQAEEALRDSEERFRRVFEDGPVGMALIGTDFRFLSVNAALCQILKYTPEELTQRTFLDITHPEDREENQQFAEAMFHRGKAGYRMEKRYLAKDGQVVWINASASAIRDQHGRTIRAIGIIENITERKEAEQALRQSEARFRSITETASDAIISADSRGHIVSWNQGARRLFGYAEAEVLGQPLTILMPPEARQAHVAALQRVSAGGDRRLIGQTVDLNALNKAGQLVPVELSLSAWTIGKEKYFGGILRDITQRKQQEHLDQDRRQVLEMVAQNRLLHEVLPRVLTMVERQYPGCLASILVLHEGRLEHVAPRLPVTTASHIERRALRLAAGICDRARLQQPWEKHSLVISDLADDSLWRDTPELATQLGVRRIWAMPIASEEQVVGILLLYHRDLREHEAADVALCETAAKLTAIAVEHRYLSDRLCYQARHDPLTGLPNRALFEQELQRSLAVAQRTGAMVALMFIDVDRFKLINDTLGHGAGDLLLRQVTQRLQHCVRQVDMLGRLGGDEFGLCMQGLDRPEDAAAMATKLRQALREPIELGGREICVTLSIGISLYPQDGQDVATLQRNADTAMYRVKQQGRNGHECFSPEMNAAVRETVELEAELRKALDRQQLLLHFQPQVDSTGQIVALEALLRWQHPKLGLVPPARFIPVAEESGLIEPIGTWVIQEACRQARRWHAAGAQDLIVSVNVSAIQFAQPDFVQGVLGALRDTGLEAGKLELELTESLLMQHDPQTLAKLQQLRELGVRISVDDFGTGYSCLAYLHRLPIDRLKIDRSFVSEIEQRSRDGPTAKATVIRGIISLAHSLQLAVVAEGVETPAQQEFLLSAGCDMMQGYLFGKPAPAEAWGPMLAAACCA